MSQVMTVRVRHYTVIDVIMLHIAPLANVDVLMYFFPPRLSGFEHARRKDAANSLKG